MTRLAKLEPAVVIPRRSVGRGGPAAFGPASEIARIALPENGSYVRTPARAESGSAYCDPGT